MDCMSISYHSEASDVTCILLFQTCAVNAIYSDGGLFGFQVVTNASDAGKVLKAVAGAFSDATKGGISDADVARAK